MSVRESDPSRHPLQNTDPASDPVLAESLSERLRRDTTVKHHAVEAAFAAREPFRSVQAYISMLRDYWKVLSAAEIAVELALRSDKSAVNGRITDNAALAEATRLFERRSTQILIDLRRLGATDVPSSVTSPIDCSFITTVPDAVGAWYVIEGAALGGRLLARMLKDQLNISADSGGSFFAGRGDETFAHWQKVRRVLDKILIAFGSSAEQRAIDAANRMFTEFECAFAMRSPA